MAKGNKNDKATHRVGALEKAPAEGLQAMTYDDVAAYLQQVAQGTAALFGLEQVIANRLKAANQRRAGIEQRIAQLRLELDQLSAEAIKAQGEMDAQTWLIVFAEDERRTRAPHE